MNFHITFSLPKSFRFSKSACLLILAFIPMLTSCKESEASENGPPKAEETKTNPLEAEIKRMLLTQKDDPKKLTKLVKGKPWKELLSACMKVEKAIDPKPSKNRIIWSRLAVRSAFYEASAEEHRKEKAENLKRMEALLREMAKEEGLLSE